MAFDIKKTDHLFVPFNRFGVALRDSKQNTRIYKNRETLDRYCNYRTSEQPYETRHNDYVEVVEYAPVVHARWDEDHKCTHCGVDAVHHDIDGETVVYYPTRCCPHCGERMDGEVQDE